MKPTLLAAIVLVFIDITKELPLTLIIRPSGFETLQPLHLATPEGNSAIAHSLPQYYLLGRGWFGPRQLFNQRFKSAC